MKARDVEIMDKYPLLYRGRHLGPRHNLMCFGFECGPGWYGLLDRLSAGLEKEIEKYRNEHPGEDFPYASQVKEKFGTLRFYMGGGYTEHMDELIRQAEEESSYTCENCGSTEASSNTDGWVRVLCNKCRGV